MLVIAGGWIAKQTNDNYSIRPLDNINLQRINRIAARLELTATRRPDANLAFLLGREGQRVNLGLLLVDPRNNEFSYGFPQETKLAEDLFLELIYQQQAFSIRTAGGVFFGPRALEIDGQLYYLFAGKPLPHGAMKRLLRSNPILLAISIIIISGLLCGFLAWSLVRPIRALQKSAQLVTQGDLSQRVDFADSRGDELGALGRDFNAMTQQIEALIGSQKRLVADISHELRSPLARLQLAIGIAQDRSNEISEHVHTQLLRIEKEAQQIDTMIERVLQLSRLEAKSPLEQRQIIPLQELLERVIDDVIFEAQDMDVEVQVEPIPVIDISCFPNLLVSAVHNVLTNAVKYCNNKVEVLFTTDKYTLTIIIKDDGPGVPEQDLQKMFEPFYRLSASRSRDSGGVGLGLAIVKQAMAMHRGDVVATNRDLSGLQVSLQIPLSK